MANADGICYQLAFSGTVYDRLQIYGIEHSSAPIATFYYGYVTPTFAGNSVFLNNLQTDSNRRILKMNGTTLSMVAYSSTEARAAMIIQESSNGVVIKANYEGNYLDAANGNSGHPVAGSTVSGCNRQRQQHRSQQDNSRKPNRNDLGCAEMQTPQAF
jgi:hypothetical protein